MKCRRQGCPNKPDGRFCVTDRGRLCDLGLGRCTYTNKCLTEDCLSYGHKKRYCYFCSRRLTSKGRPRGERQRRYERTERGRRLRRARKTQREERIRRNTPGWADLKAIREFYARCPIGHHVDHIIPLKGKDVSGLHVLDNLQYLPARENIIKGNRFDIKAAGAP